MLTTRWPIKNITIEEIAKQRFLIREIVSGLGLAVLSLHSVQLEPDLNKLTAHDVEGFIEIKTCTLYPWPSKYRHGYHPPTAPAGNQPYHPMGSCG
jgi:hypothetical protein